MAFNPKLYPPNWKQIRADILARAGNKCEWCGAPNGVTGVRDTEGVFHDMDEMENMPESCFPETYKYIKIVLTVAHVHDRNPMNPDPNNLAALCQRCHLRHDTKQRMESAAKRRDAKKRSAALGAGQMEML